jgi:3'-5' exoribonuclease 1
VNSYGEVRGSFDRFVRPVRYPKLSYFCRNLTQINQQDVDRADTFVPVIEEFMEWARIEEESYQLVSWGGFDKTMLVDSCIRSGLAYTWAFEHVNLKESYRLLRNKKAAIGLMKACAQEGIEATGQQHRAISDAENLTKLFLKHLGSWPI